MDLTQGRIYTLSDATRGYLAELREPLLVRGYFSASTHPLLAPLVPQLRDLLAEYAVAGRGRVRVEFVDPHDDPAVEQEAASRYGIRPVPFQTATKYQAAVVNSYFDVLVSYGDQYQVLGFRDLIDVKARSEGDFEVALKNPEYDITRAIRKVIDTYQGGDSLTDFLGYHDSFRASDGLPVYYAVLPHPVGNGERKRAIGAGAAGILWPHPCHPCWRWRSRLECDGA